VVATTKTEANKAPAVPACSARCEVSIGTSPFQDSFARDHLPRRNHDHKGRAGF
jgi:hypothetical protein